MWSAGLGFRPPRYLIVGARQAESVKWRTAVGGGSPLGPEGAATPVPGGERAGSG